MKNNKPELLSPAGSYPALTAAIHAGCNAVYLGGEKYGARANAENFTNESLSRAIDFAHLNNVKIYYTANTLIKEDEMEGLINQINFLYKEGIDAIILQDLGAYHMIHRYFPTLPLHASTQMTIHSLKGTLFVENLGFERVVLSRELSLQEISHIRENSTIELECFIHGALCYSYSGQCLFSSLIGGRSGNRGSCAQPCRLPYELYENNKKVNNSNHPYLLSPKDIQTLTILPELIKSNIHSFKIEGRMKNPNYVGLITSLYRKYIDLFMENPDHYLVDQADILDMHQIYNRGGFSNGYFFTRNGKEMMSSARPNHQGIEIGKVTQVIDNKNLHIQLNGPISQGDCIEIVGSSQSNISYTAKENINTLNYELSIDTKFIRKNAPVYKLLDVNLAREINENILSIKKKLPLNLVFKGKIGEKSCLIIKYQKHQIEVQGSLVESAQTVPISKEKISLQLSKTGDSPFVAENVELFIDDHIFISIKELNSMRRKALLLLTEKILKETKRDLLPIEYNREKNVNPFNKDDICRNKINVLIRNWVQYKTCIKYPIDAIYLELTLFSLKEIEMISIDCKRLNIEIWIALPKIIRDEKTKYIMDLLEVIKKFSIKGVVARTIDGYELVKDYWPVILDLSLNVFNNQTIRFWENANIEQIGISPELNFREISRLKGKSLEVLIYGIIPLMTSAQCLSPEKNIFLKDRKNIIFKTSKDCKMCINTIYNSVPLVLIDKYKELNQVGIHQFRIEFLDEEANDIDEIMKYAIGVKNNTFLTAQDLDHIEPFNMFTRGHFTRGVK